MTTFTMPTGYEKIDGKLYPTSSSQAFAYEDIRVYGTPGKPGAFLYGKPREKAVAEQILPKYYPLSWPLDKIFITQAFGMNPQIYSRFGMRGHDGIDLRTRFIDSLLAHRPVKAAADGWCEVHMDGSSGYGNHVRIHHPDGSLTIYGHLSSVGVYQKQIVIRGQQIGVSGNSGFSDGPHLHFEYRPANCDTQNGYAGAIDPIPLLPPTSGLLST